MSQGSYRRFWEQIYAGVDVKEAQRLLAHSSIRVTLDIYTHLTNDKKELSSKLDSFAM